MLQEYAFILLEQLNCGVCPLQVADFGLAKLTESGSGTGIVGTFGYMPPEYAFLCTRFNLLDKKLGINSVAKFGLVGYLVTCFGVTYPLLRLLFSTPKLLFAII